MPGSDLPGIIMQYCIHPECSLALMAQTAMALLPDTYAGMSIPESPPSCGHQNGSKRQNAKKLKAGQDKIKKPNTKKEKITGQKFMKNRWFGNREFYRKTLYLAVPMILQNLITNFVSMLDNIMVGQIGTPQMSGVSIVNQFIFVFNMTIFGGVSGASIFGTQFFGKGDCEGQKYTFRFRIILSVLGAAAFALILKLFGTPLISLFLSSEDTPEMIRQTLGYGEEYLKIMLWGLWPYAIGQAYASVIRECGETRVPMTASFAAVGINLLLDYGLIFGKLGMPQLGVAGAAIATVIAKSCEAVYMILWGHLHTDRIQCLKSAFRGFRIPGVLAGEILIKGCPLMINELLWSLGMSTVAQCYSVRGIDVVAARNIATTLTNLLNVIYIQIGACTGIMVGMLLGAGKPKEARETDDKLIAFSMMVTVFVSLLVLPASRLFPALYNTEEEVRSLAAYFILIQAFAMPIWSYTNSCYFTLRCGGKTLVTFLFDAVYTWGLMIPLAFILSRFTALDIHVIFPIVTYSELIKVVVGWLLVRSDVWINDLTGEGNG